MQRIPIARNGMHHIAVAALPTLKPAHPMHRAVTPRDIAFAKITPRQMLHRRRRRFLDADVNPLAGGVDGPRKQRPHDADHGVITARMVGLQTDRPHRLIAWITAHVQHPAQRREHRVLGLVVAIRPGLSERRDRDRINAGLMACRRSQPSPNPAIRPARSFDHEVGRLRQREDISTPLRIQIQRQRALVEIVEPEEQTSILMRQVVIERTDWRPASPPGGSTLMTSAPISARRRPQKYARCVLKSSTRSPASALGEVTIYFDVSGGWLRS